MEHGRICVDLTRLGELARTVSKAYDEIMAAPGYAFLGAGDRDGKLERTMMDYIKKNKHKREKLERAMGVARDALTSSSDNYVALESKLVNALKSDEVHDNIQA